MRRRRIIGTLGVICNLAFFAIFFSACKTTTVVVKTDHGYWVCDAENNGSKAKPEVAGCGANPEKGLNKTCFAEKPSRQIAEIRELADNALLVTCGDIK